MQIGKPFQTATSTHLVDVTLQPQWFGIHRGFDGGPLLGPAVGWGKQGAE